MFTIFLALSWIVLSSLAAVTGVFLVRRSVSVSTLESHKEIAGFVYATVGVMYGVLMTFVCVVVWGQFSDARALAQRESTTIATLYHLAEGFTPADRDLVQELLRSYTATVVNVEWEAMNRGQSSPEAWSFSDRLWQTYVAMPDSERQRFEYQQSLTEMTTFYGLRSDRLLDNQQHVPPVIWYVLVVGAMITIGFTYLFGVYSLRAQLVMTVALTTTIVGILFLIYVLDTPFNGDVRVGTGAYQPLFGLFDALKH